MRDDHTFAKIDKGDPSKSEFLIFGGFVNGNRTNDLL